MQQNCRLVHPVVQRHSGEQEYYVLPYLETRYDSDDWKNTIIKRTLFDRDHNFMTTTSEVLSFDLLKSKVLEWDVKFSTKSRPLIDIFISCPVELDGIGEGRNEMKNEVHNIIETLKKSISFPHYKIEKTSDELRLNIYTPFHPHKFDQYNPEGDLISHTLTGQEIKNSMLYVLYYPDTSIVSSCLIEAAWAINAGVCCLFILGNPKIEQKNPKLKSEKLLDLIEKKTMPRYLRRDALTDYPIVVCHKNFDFRSKKIVRKMSKKLGNSINLKALD